VTIALNPPSFWRTDRLEVSGYECQAEGVDLVVHRSLAKARSGIGPHDPRLSKTYWSVTEPRTGTAICEGTSRQTRSIADAIERAEIEIANNGGKEGVEKAVIQKLAQQSLRGISEVFA